MAWLIETLFGTLPHVFALCQVVDAQPVRGELLVEPRARVARIGAETLQLTCELQQERIARAGPGEGWQRWGRLWLRLRQRQRELLGVATRTERVLDPHGDAAQVFDQHRSQRERQGPQLRKLQRRSALARTDEAREHGRIEPAVGMRDVLTRERPDARQTGRIAGPHQRQRAATVARQVAELIELLFDQMEIVEEPAARRGNLPLGVLGCLHLGQRTAQPQAIGPCALGQHGGGTVRIGDDESRRDIRRTARESVRVQQLGPQGQIGITDRGAGCGRLPGQQAADPFPFEHPGKALHMFQTRGRVTVMT